MPAAFFFDAPLNEQSSPTASIAEKAGRRQSNGFAAIGKNVHDADFKALFTDLEARKTPEHAILEARIAT
ncbi:MAG: hypothetical protein IIA09_11815 [Proteobacteria bacterium]|nr:hypothetical protein [Pseudomonadota bacterium]